MYFDDEKDLIKDGTDIQVNDDGTVVWDDILDTSDDELVSISNNDTKKVEEAKIPENFSDSIDDDELLSILDSSDSGGNGNASVEQPVNQNTENYEDFDLDKQLNNANLDDSGVDSGFKIPEKKKAGKNNSTMLLLIVLFIILLGGGIYYGLEFFKGQDVSQGDLERNKTVQDSMDEATREDIEKRAEENADSTIPVANEENVDEIKPEEAEEDSLPEEKKEVITVVPTGRPDPFMPIQKYLKVEIPETVVRYDRAGIVKPPSQYGLEDEATNKMLTISVSGIMYDTEKPSAIITFEDNDYFVQIGDKLDDYKVVDIGKNFVTVALGKNLYKASVGEEFKLTDFFGNAKYLTDRYDGGRQYRSISKANDYFENTKQKHVPGQYVSDSDVEINVK